jgi:hypothetical protein
LRKTEISARFPLFIGLKRGKLSYKIEPHKKGTTQKQKMDRSLFEGLYKKSYFIVYATTKEPFYSTSFINNCSTTPHGYGKSHPCYPYVCSC